MFNSNQILYLETFIKEMFLAQLQTRISKTYIQDWRLSDSAFFENSKP